MDLVLIEGAGKVKKISQILGNNYKVIATCGHIERLKDSEYDQTGIDKDLNFHFEWIEGKFKIIKEINELAKLANNVYIASDPDREGEGIAWHIYNKLFDKSKAKRITFNEISEKAIKEALKQPREIDINYVNAYLARIALDKKVGFGLSKYLQKNVHLPSAGRVQSVVLKLIKEREDEINNFIPSTCCYFEPIINGIKLEHSKTYNSHYFDLNDQKSFSFSTKEKAINYQKEFLNQNEWKLFFVSEAKQKTSYPVKPFKTSTIQAKLIKELNINSKKAESILQTLYQQGYITYPRTDATRISEDFCNEAYNFVKSKFPKLANNEFRFNKSNSHGAQDAHECIRVLHLEQVNIDEKDQQLIDAYNIIYKQTIIQFMNPCISEVTEFNFINNKDEFVAKSTIILDQGFNEYLNKNKEDKIINFELNKIYQADNFNDLIKSSTTTPPSPFNQSSLIKELEKLQIGRPSTYASSVEVNNTRGYTTKDKKEILSTTENGRLANDTLLKNWSELINYTFTADMEKALDDIAERKQNYKNYLKNFLSKFEEKLYSFISENGNSNETKKEIVGKCPKCGKDLILKTTKNGKKLKECSGKKWNPKTKKTSGCDYYEWINDEK